jgi:hypothetical protein
MLESAIERKLTQGDKALVGNAGFRRFLADPAGQGFTIDALAKKGRSFIEPMRESAAIFLKLVGMFGLSWRDCSVPLSSQFLTATQTQLAPIESVRPR